MRWLLIAAAWSVVGFLSAAHWHFFFLQDDPYTWWQLLRIKIFLWFMWGGFTVWIVRLGRRYRPEGRAWMQHLGVLLAASVGVVVLYLALYVLAVQIHLGRPLEPQSLISMTKFIIWTHSTFYYLAFWATIGIDYAFVYFRKYRERELLASRLEAELTQAQLQSLRSKLQPHFLFNALNAISSLVYAGERERAYDMIARLAELLRASLHTNDSHLVTLESELAFTRQYLEILRLRFPDRLQLAEDLAPETLSAEVPSLLLQPLVENAVKHGMAGNGNALKVEIRSQRDGDALVLEVHDTGPGLPADWTAERSGGFGLRGTRQRLQTLYEDRHAFKLDRNADGNTVATIRIPFRIPGIEGVAS